MAHFRTIYNDIHYSTKEYPQFFIETMAKTECRCVEYEYRDDFYIGDIVKKDGKKYMVTKNGIVSNNEKIPFSKDLEVIYPCRLKN